MQGNPLQGAGYVLRGAKLLPHPRLRLFVIIPLAVNTLVFGSLLGVGYGYLSSAVDGMMAALPEWLGFLEWILWPLIVLTASLITGYLFSLVALIIASPFNGLLAEKAEEVITGKEVSSLEGIGAAIADIPRAVFKEIRKILYYIPMALFVLILSFIPALNVVSPLLWFLLGAWMMSLQYLDYPMDNHRLDFNEVKLAAQERRLSSLGFGGLVALCASIPIVNFFIMPSAVVGATLLWCEELQGGGGRGRVRG